MELHRHGRGGGGAGRPGRGVLPDSAERGGWGAGASFELTLDGETFSDGLPITFFELVHVAIGRRPYITEASGEILLRTDSSLDGQALQITARLPCAGSHSGWSWNVTGGLDLTLPLSFDGLPPRLHNDMQFVITLPDGRRVEQWRRFMRVPWPTQPSVEPVQVDHSRAGLLVGSKPFLATGYYMGGWNDSTIGGQIRALADSGLTAAMVYPVRFFAC